MMIMQQNRLFMTFGASLVLLVILLGGYFYFKKSAHDYELKLNTTMSEIIELKEKNKILIEREQETLNQMTAVQQDKKDLMAELANLKLLNQDLQQEKTLLTEKIDEYKAKSDASAANTTNNSNNSVLPSVINSGPISGMP